MQVAAILAPYFLAAFTIAVVFEAMDAVMTGAENTVARVLRLGRRAS